MTKLNIFMTIKFTSRRNYLKSNFATSRIIAKQILTQTKQ